MNFEFQNIIMQILFFLFLFRIIKIKISTYFLPQYLLYITFFCEKWFIISVFSPFSPS